MKYKVPETTNPRNLNNGQIFQTGLSFLSANFQTPWTLLWKMGTWHRCPWQCWHLEEKCTDNMTFYCRVKVPVPVPTGVSLKEQPQRRPTREFKNWSQAYQKHLLQVPNLHLLVISWLLTFLQVVLQVWALLPGTREGRRNEWRRAQQLRGHNSPGHKKTLTLASSSCCFFFNWFSFSLIFSLNLFFSDTLVSKKLKLWNTN